LRLQQICLRLIAGSRGLPPGRDQDDTKGQLIFRYSLTLPIEYFPWRIDQNKPAPALFGGPWRRRVRRTPTEDHHNWDVFSHFFLLQRRPIEEISVATNLLRFRLYKNYEAVDAKRRDPIGGF
jgi:hypothetical protein